MGKQPAIDYFVSYTGKDEVHARLVVDALEAVGYRCTVQYRDFVPG